MHANRRQVKILYFYPCPAEKRQPMSSPVPARVVAEKPRERAETFIPIKQ